VYRSRQYYDSYGAAAIVPDKEEDQSSQVISVSFNLCGPRLSNRNYDIAVRVWRVVK